MRPDFHSRSWCEGFVTTCVFIAFAALVGCGPRQIVLHCPQPEPKAVTFQPGGSLTPGIVLAPGQSWSYGDNALERK